jgi:hypothetical protein
MLQNQTPNYLPSVLKREKKPVNPLSCDCVREKETGRLRRQCGVTPHFPFQWQKCFRIEEAGPVGVCAVWLINGLPTFRRMIPPPLSKLKVRELTHKPEDEGGTFLRKFEKNFSNHTAQQPRRPGYSALKPSNHCSRVVQNILTLSLPN